MALADAASCGGGAWLARGRAAIRTPGSVSATQAATAKILSPAAVGAGIRHILQAGRQDRQGVWARAGAENVLFSRPGRRLERGAASRHDGVAIRRAQHDSFDVLAERWLAAGP